MRTTDRRFIRTEKVIIKAMMKLLAKKELGRISVADLCNEADVNKSTLYLHYQSIDQLIATIEDMAISLLSSLLYQTSDIWDFENVVPSVTELIKTNKREFSAAVQGGQFRFFEKLIDLLSGFYANQGAPRKNRKKSGDFDYRAIGHISSVVSIYIYILKRGKLSNTEFINSSILLEIDSFGLKNSVN